VSRKGSTPAPVAGGSEADDPGPEA